MTRGREVQDFLRSQRKTARQMFEEHEFAYDRDELFSVSVPHLKIVDQIIYDDGYKKIVFDLITKSYACMNHSDSFEAIDMEDNKLIQAQLKELGWV